MEQTLKHIWNTLFSRLGYTVAQTKKSGDRGADLILSKNSIKYVVQVKFSTSNNIGFDAVKEAHTGNDYYNASKAAVITNNNFTKQVIESAKKLNVVLVNGNKLNQLANAITQILEFALNTRAIPQIAK